MTDKDRPLAKPTVQIDNDPKTIRTQRVLHITEDTLEYELNMATHQASEFQNHLAASLKKVSSFEPEPAIFG